MQLTYKTFNKKDLKNLPLKAFVGHKSYQVNYLAFSSHDTSNNAKPPVVILGGAFQTFNSFKYCLDYLLPEHPVVMVDLPSLGENPQLAPEIGMEDMSDILYDFLMACDLHQVSIMGLSISSVIGSTFAYKHPEMMHKLLILGIIPKPRKAWKRLVEISFDFLTVDNALRFSHAVVLFLANYSYLKETGLSGAIRKLFQRQMSRLDDNGRQRYDANGLRLLRIEGIIGYPSCETLVLTGEYDNFTLPFENALFAQRCPNARFVLVKNADHLPQLERRHEIMTLFNEFYSGRSTDDIEGIIPIERKYLGRLTRRGAPRFDVSNPFASLYSADGITVKPVKINNISFSGCSLSFSSDSGLLTSDNCNGLWLEIPGFGERLELIAFSHDESCVRCIFMHQDMPLAEAFLQWLFSSGETVKIEEDARYLVPGRIEETLAQWRQDGAQQQKQQ